jgi:YbbR domain-containing protein
MMQKLKSKLIKSIKSKKINVFALFFLLALFFLIISKLSSNYTETIQLDIVLKNQPQEHKVSISSNQKIAIEVETHGFKLLSYSLFKPQMTIDFKTDIILKNDKYVWTSKKAMPNIHASLGNSVNILSVQPDTLVFSFEKMKVKRVPVVLNSDFTLKSGYDMSSSIKMIPDSITIVGSEHQVSKIEVIKTKTVTLTNLHSNFKQVVEIQRSEHLKSLSLSHESVEISAKVDKFTEGVFDIPVTILNLPEDKRINYFPKTISVVYYVSLANYKYIKPEDFKIECDYMDALNFKQSFLIPKLTKFPRQIKSARLKQHKVEFILMQ